MRQGTITVAVDDQAPPRRSPSSRAAGSAGCPPGGQLGAETGSIHAVPCPFGHMGRDDYAEPTVLLVTDTDDVRRSTSLYLRRSGHEDTDQRRGDRPRQILRAASIEDWWPCLLCYSRRGQRRRHRVRVAASLPQTGSPSR